MFGRATLLCVCVIPHFIFYQNLNCVGTFRKSYFICIRCDNDVRIIIIEFYSSCIHFPLKVHCTSCIYSQWFIDVYAQA